MSGWLIVGWVWGGSAAAALMLLSWDWAVQARRDRAAARRYAVERQLARVRETYRATGDGCLMCLLRVEAGVNVGAHSYYRQDVA